jgi:hypothetical protein
VFLICVGLEEACLDVPRKEEEVGAPVQLSALLFLGRAVEEDVSEAEWWRDRFLVA